MLRNRNLDLHYYGLHGATRWYPILLHDRLSVDQLNDLLEKGWYIPKVGGPELRFPVFYISPEVHDGLQRDLKETPMPADTGTHLLVMLRQGSGEQRQVAVEMPVDSRGYKDFGALLRFLKNEQQWGSHLTLTINRSLTIAILERRKIAPGEKS